MAKDNSLIMIVGIGAAAWYAYTQGWFSSLGSVFTPAASTFPAGFTPISTSVMPLAQQIQFITLAQASGNSTGMIQSLLNGMAAQAATCAPGSFTPFAVSTNNASGTSGGCNTTRPTPLTIVTPPANPPVAQPPVTTPASLASLLTAAAGSGGQFGLNLDQWLYYYNQLPGKTPVTGDQVFKMIANQGFPRTQVQDVDSFVGALNSVGLSGFGNLGYARRIPVPTLIVRSGRGFGKYDLGDLRRAGGR